MLTWLPLADSQLRYAYDLWAMARPWQERQGRRRRGRRLGFSIENLLRSSAAADVSTKFCQLLAKWACPNPLFLPVSLSLFLIDFSSTPTRHSLKRSNSCEAESKLKLSDKILISSVMVYTPLLPSLPFPSYQLFTNSD